MGRSPCCAKEGLNRGAWTAMEDKILTEYIRVNGEGKWRNLPKRAGLKRCGKSCRLRWLNYLRPDIKRGNITNDEEDLIIRLHKLLGNRWSLIAGRLPGRTDNEIKNYWNTNIGKKFVQAHPSPTSNRKASNQSKEKSQPPAPRIGSGVVRTKASRCTKVFIRPEPQNSTDHQQLILEPKPVLGEGPTIHGSDCVGAAAGPDPLDDISPFMISAKDDPSDFIVDFEMDDKFLSDLLNTDFTSLCDEDVETNYTSSSSLNSSPTDLFSTHDSVKARFSEGMFNDSDLQSMTPLLGIEWLPE
ncbi:hypothetical protein RHMOL_Rhmol12G0245600 [Rhododendron molle]|uniref:Uncharacterized protein n=1 Tax=Rhododendron molle TaxID=49168 RepID=A0ACC0LM90_RHOML|nr:hypothetical protein RHMOL_Rhmol12G0245600 [Rhododendron molle]